MGNHNSNISNLQTQFISTIVEDSQESCLADSSTEVEGNVIIVNGDVGNVAVANAWNRGANATCAMNNTMSAQLTNLINSAASNSTSATTGIMGTLLTFQTTFNENNLSQTVMNNVTQTISSTCQASTTTDVEQNYIVIQNTDAKNGVITGANAVSSQVSSNCVMQNASKLATFNQASAKVSDETKYSTTGVIFAAILAIGLIVLVAGGAALAVWMFFKKPAAPPADKNEASVANPADFAKAALGSLTKT